MGRIYIDGPPSLTNLARDFSELDAAGGWPGETALEARERATTWKRLLRAAKVEEDSGGRLSIFLLRRGILRYGLWMAIALLSLVLLRPGNWIVTTSLAELIMLLVVSGALGVMVAALQWASARQDYLWASVYRDEYHAGQQRMLRPEGDDGFRIVRNAAGNWEYVQTPER